MPRYDIQLEKEQINVALQSVHYIDAEGNMIAPNGESFVLPKNGEVREQHGYVTATKVGELDAGTDITGKTALEVLGMMLDAEYAPRWIDATASLSGGTTLCVGDAIPSAASFVASGTAAMAVGKTTARGGEPTDTKSVDSNTLAADGAKADFGAVVVRRGVATIRLSRAYSAGTEQVVTSKGNATNKTAANATTKLVNAAVNANVDADTFIIRRITKAATQTVNFALPIYIDETQQTLSYTAAEYSKTKAIAAGDNIMLEVPSSYTNVKVAYFDSVAQSWVDITYNCVQTSETKMIGANNVSVAYTRLVYAEVVGERPYRITFNIA